MGEDDKDNEKEALDTPSYKHRQRQRRRTGGGDKWEHRKEKIGGVPLVTSVTLCSGWFNMLDCTLLTEKNPIRFGSTTKSRIDGFPSVSC